MHLEVPTYYSGGPVPAAIVCIVILLGMGAIALLNERLPHEHFAQGREGPEAALCAVSGCLCCAILPFTTCRKAWQ